MISPRNDIGVHFESTHMVTFFYSHICHMLRIQNEENVISKACSFSVSMRPMKHRYSLIYFTWPNCNDIYLLKSTVINVIIFILKCRKLLHKNTWVFAITFWIARVCWRNSDQRSQNDLKIIVNHSDITLQLKSV